MSQTDLHVGYHILTKLPPIPFQSIQRFKVRFENGYGARIVAGPLVSYPYPRYELWVIHHNDELCYKTSITDHGWLDDTKLNLLLDEIAQLPRKDECKHV